MSANTTWTHTHADRGHVVTRTRSMSGRRIPGGLFVVELNPDEFRTDPGEQYAIRKIFPEQAFTHHYLVRSMWAYVKSDALWTNAGGEEAVTMRVGYASLSEDPAFEDDDAFLVTQNLSAGGWKGILGEDKGAYFQGGQTLPMGLGIGGLEQQTSAPAYVIMTLNAGKFRTTNDIPSGAKLRIFIDYVEFER